MSPWQTFKDLFSSQARSYAAFRPHYPNDLYRYLLSLCSATEVAWDCATGNGQAAKELAQHFKEVWATDASQGQLDNAVLQPNIRYQVAPAEATPFPPHSVDLITVAQAFHWFDQAAFFAEARRVGKPGAVLAIWSYHLCKVSPAVDEVVAHLYADILGPFWEKERRLVEEGYRHCPFPLHELTPPFFRMEARWSLEALVGYLGTWSALQTYLKKQGHHNNNPLAELLPKLQEAWGDAEDRQVRWPLTLRVGLL